MRDRLRQRVVALLFRLRRLERRELHDFRRWLETTENLLHLSLLVLMPLIIGGVTVLSNAIGSLSFLLYPPLASGTYTLFAEPEGRYSTPRRFVGGLLVGALSGWLALLFSTTVLGVTPPTGPFEVSAIDAALAVFLTVAATWTLDVEEPAAYSTALLALLVPRETMPTFVASVVVSTAVVAVVFVVWRDRFYEQRAEILYESTKGDDHVLVPMSGPNPHPTAMLGARIAAAHDAGKVVLLDVVADAEAATAELDALDRGERLATDGGEQRTPDATTPHAPDGGEARPPDSDDQQTAEDGERAVAATAQALEERAATIEDEVGVTCEVVVAVDGTNRAGTIERAARRANCDLLVVPYASSHGVLANYVRRLFRSEFDVVVHRSADPERTVWKRVLVPVRGASDVAHSMVDFALRLAGDDGHVGVSHCVGDRGDHRRAEAMLANVVEPFAGPIETRVSRESIEEYLTAAATDHDLVLIGASRDRSKASRLISPPTFERIETLETDIAIVDRH